MDGAGHAGAARLSFGQSVLIHISPRAFPPVAHIITHINILLNIDLHAVYQQVDKSLDSRGVDKRCNDLPMNDL
jgi:hypothetical protein